MKPNGEIWAREKNRTNGKKFQIENCLMQIENNIELVGLWQMERARTRLV